MANKYDEQLDVDSLIFTSKHAEIRHLVAKSLYAKCVKQIKDANSRRKVKFCIFTPPIFNDGLPMIVDEDIINYLKTKLESQALYVQVLEKSRLLISWDIRVIDATRYNSIQKVKKRVRISDDVAVETVVFNNLNKNIVVRAK
jgi:hypothetical protein